MKTEINSSIPPEIRLKIYREALFYLVQHRENVNTYLCWLLRKVMYLYAKAYFDESRFMPNYEISMLLPEFKAQEPNAFPILGSTAWFHFTKQGLEQRIKCLEKCIYDVQEITNKQPKEQYEK